MSLGQLPLSRSLDELVGVVDGCAKTALGVIANAYPPGTTRWTSGRPEYHENCTDSLNYNWRAGGRSARGATARIAATLGSSRIGEAATSSFMSQFTGPARSVARARYI